MANPIRRTPTLKGAHAERFLELMLQTSSRPMNKTEKKLLQMINS